MTRTGNKYDMIIPLLPKAADEYYRAIIDNVCWYHFRNRERFLLIRGSDYAMAGTALAANNHFLTKSKQQVFAIPMGTSAVDGYDYLIRSFNNEQEEGYEKDTTQFVEQAIKTSEHEKLRKRK